jgi:hypothetical protein
MAKKTGTVSRIDVLTLKPSEAAIAIRHMIKVNLQNAQSGKKRRGLFMWGGPGISKSSLVEQIAAELNLELVDVRLTQMEPTDLRGIPVAADGENGEVVVKWAVPNFFPRRNEGSKLSTPVDRATGHKYDGAIILLDELPNAPPSVQAASYQLVLDGKLGEYFVPNNVVVLASGNRETDKGSTFRMPTPLMNRFTHIEVKPDFEDWQTYALSTSFHKDVVGYLSAFKHELYEFDPLSASRGFATPRSWEAVSDILHDDPNLPEQVRMGLIAGTVGDGIAVKFIEYAKNAATLPKSEDILEGKVSKLNNKDTSLMYALTTALCYELRERSDSRSRLKGPELVVANKRFNNNVDNFLGFMMSEFQPEMVIMGARTALALFKLRFDVKEMKNWSAFSDRYQKLILQV